MYDIHMYYIHMHAYIHVYDMGNILCHYDIYIYMTTIYTKIHLYVAILSLCHKHNTNSVILGA